VAVGIESKEIAKSLDGNCGAGDGIILWDGRLEEDFQRFPGASAQLGEKLPVVKEITAQDLRDAEDKMPVGNLFEDIRAEPLPEFHHAFLVAGGTEVPALAGKSQPIFMAAVLAFDLGKAVMRVAAVEIPVNDLLQIRRQKPYCRENRSS